MSDSSIDGLVSSNDLKSQLTDLESENIELFHLIESLQSKIKSQSIELESYHQSPSIPYILSQLHDNKNLYLLNSCQSIQLKEELLRESCNSTTYEIPELIITVTEYLSNTLLPKIFLNLIKKYPLALKLYIANQIKYGNYYKNSNNNNNNNNNNNSSSGSSSSSASSAASTAVEIHSNLFHLLKTLGRSEEAGISQLRSALATEEPAIQQIKLRKCAEEYELNSNNTNNIWISKQLHSAADLLERQLIIQQVDQIEKEEKQKSLAKQQRKPSLLQSMSLSKSSASSSSAATEPSKEELAAASSSAANFVGSPLYTTIRHCLFHYGTQPDTHFASPTQFRHHFQVPDSTFTWLAMEVCTAKRDYEGLKSLVPKNNNYSQWFGGSSHKSPIGFEPFLSMLKIHNGPIEVLEYFCGLINDKEEKYKMAIKYNLYEFAIRWIQENKQYHRLFGLQEESIRVLGDKSNRCQQIRQTIQIILNDPKVQKLLSK